MRICIYTGNHGNSLSIADLVRLLKCAVADCGYDVCVSHEPLSGCCNLMIEHFIDAPVLQQLVARKTPDTRYVLIGTELITGGTFNGGVTAGHWHYANRDYWKLRYDGFHVAAALADAVWVLSELVVPAYQAELPGKPVRYLPHAHVNGLGQVEHLPEHKKDIDFYFSGTLTDHRRAILSELARDHQVVFSPQQTPDYLRLDQLGRAKVCLSLRLSPENDLPSLSRMHFHIQNRNFMVHEAYARESLLDPYALHAPTEDLIAWSKAALDLSNRRSIADDILTRFKADLPMTRWMQPLLAEATGQSAPGVSTRPQVSSRSVPVPA